MPKTAAIAATSMSSDGFKPTSALESGVHDQSRTPSIFWLASLLLPLPHLTSYFATLWRQEHYQYFPALLAALGLLIYSQWDRRLRLPATLLAWLLVSVGLLLCVIATILQSPWVSAVGWVSIFGGWLRTHRSQRDERFGLLYLWPPAWLLIRLPVNLDLDLITWLQRGSSQVSSYFLDYLQVPHLLQGVLITLPSANLFVEEACSGVQSVFSLLFCALLLVAWLRRSPILLPLYAVTAVFWAGILNVVRIVSIAWVRQHYEYDLSTGWQHDLLGFLTLGIAILLLLSSDRLFRVVFFPVPSSTIGAAKFINPIQKIWNNLFVAYETLDTAVENGDQDQTLPSKRRDDSSISSDRAMYIALVPMAVLALCIVPQSKLLIRDVSSGSLFEGRSESGVLGMFDVAPVWLPTQTLFEGILSDFGKVGYRSVRDGEDPTLGRFADIWSVDLDGTLVSIIVSQAYYEIHDLEICYRNAGWLIVNSSHPTVSLDGMQSWETSELSLQRSDWRQWVVYSGLDTAGKPDGFSTRRRFFDRLQVLLSGSNFLSSLRSSGSNGDGRMIMLQLVAAPSDRLNSSQLNQLRDLHAQSVKVFSDAMASRTADAGY